MFEENDNLEIEVVIDEGSTTSPEPDEAEIAQEAEEEAKRAQLLADSEGD